MKTKHALLILLANAAFLSAMESRKRALEDDYMDVDNTQTTTNTSTKRHRALPSINSATQQVTVADQENLVSYTGSTYVIHMPNLSQILSNNQDFLNVLDIYRFMRNSYMNTTMDYNLTVDKYRDAIDEQQQEELGQLLNRYDTELDYLQPNLDHQATLLLHHFSSITGITRNLFSNEREYEETVMSLLRGINLL